MKKYAIKIPFPYGDFLYLCDGDKIRIYDSIEDAKWDAIAWKKYEIVEYNEK